MGCFMKNSLVVKDNALINASYNLELTEQRLIMLAIINARESGQGITAEANLKYMLVIMQNYLMCQLMRHIRHSEKP